jgi:hypothetical protein
LNFHAKIAAELEEPLFLPKQPIKTPANVENMEEDNDSEDIPLLLRSERRKQKATGSRTSLMEVTLSSVKTSHPLKRSISVHDISTNKENTKIPNKSIEVDSSASLPPGNRSPGVQERSESSAKQLQTSQQTNNATQIGTELLPSNTSNTDKLTKSPTQRTVSLRNIPPTDVNNTEDHLNNTQTQTQETENHPQLTKLATEVSFITVNMATLSISGRMSC